MNIDKFKILNHIYVYTSTPLDLIPGFVTGRKVHGRSEDEY